MTICIIMKLCPSYFSNVKTFSNVFKQALCFMNEGDRFFLMSLIIFVLTKGSWYSKKEDNIKSY